ncbi:BQ5605_C016g08220 [Microbotryum silenes-dioicae]|uniref:BQ5605_C016g08220 protein n=1 Tax=Microbotryum silenes-dioicae TaxID=796604 RepID=A0A2X0NZ43_9BASI|nr:BQ5605_C016g08220 [Microbotryum silenes-dioicae]
MTSNYFGPPLDGHHHYGSQLAPQVQQTAPLHPQHPPCYYHHPPQYPVSMPPANAPITIPSMGMACVAVPSHAPQQSELRPLPFNSVSAYFAVPSAAYYPLPPQAHAPSVTHSRHAFAGPSPASHDTWSRKAAEVHRDTRTRWGSHDSLSSVVSQPESESWIQHTHPAAAARDRWTEQSRQMPAREHPESFVRSIWSREGSGESFIPVNGPAAEDAVMDFEEVVSVDQHEPIVIPNADPSALIDYDLIVPMSAVPPPPPIERSAVPLADLAVEMVWDACARGANGSPARASRQITRQGRSRASLLNDSQDDVALPAARSGSRSFPQTPELFYGAIGDGRAPRKISDLSLDGGYVSDESSPGSSAPGTPENVRLASLGFAYPFVGEQLRTRQSAKMATSSDEDMLHSPVDVIRANGRRLSNKNRPMPLAFPADPTPAFRQFVRQLLTTTLVAPEDIALALHFVSRIPRSSIIPPAKAEDGAEGCTNALKSAPYKILLGALMLANKTLQDNSYRNETFAAVSGIPLKDVNDLEIHVFGSLGFDASIDGAVWAAWLNEMSRRASLGRGNIGNTVEVHAAIQRLQRAIARGSDTSSTPSSPLVGVPMVLNVAQSPRTADLFKFLPPMATPLMQCRNTALLELDMDASGPCRPAAARRSTWLDRSPTLTVAMPSRHQYVV